MRKSDEAALRRCFAEYVLQFQIQFYRLALYLLGHIFTNSYVV